MSSRVREWHNLAEPLFGLFLTYRLCDTTWFCFCPMTNSINSVINQLPSPFSLQALRAKGLIVCCESAWFHPTFIDPDFPLSLGNSHFIIPESTLSTKMEGFTLYNVRDY